MKISFFHPFIPSAVSFKCSGLEAGPVRLFRSLGFWSSSSCLFLFLGVLGIVVEVDEELGFGVRFKYIDR
jgi:hypothetical protein